MAIRDYMFNADPVAERQRLRRQAELFAEPIRDKAHRVARKAPRRILDIGCGTGEASVILCQAFPEARIVGIDRDQQALGIARRAAEDLGISRIEYVIGDFETALPDGPFDLVLASMLLQHTRRPARVLLNAHAALSESGLFWSRNTAAVRRDENLVYAQKLLHAFLDAVEAVSGPLCMAARLPALLVEAGFTAVESDQEAYPIGGPSAAGKDIAANIVHNAYQNRPLISGVFGTAEETLEQMYKDALRAVQGAGDDVIGTHHIINHVARKG
jgi:SAM-dependent methyltransferase